MGHPQNLVYLFLDYVRQYDRPDALYVKRQGQYRPISTREFYDHVVDLTYALWDLGLQKGDRVAILSENRPEWYYADLATLGAGGISVPIYPTLPPGQIAFILKDCQAKGIFVSTMEQLEKIVDIADSVKDFLRFVIIYEPLGQYRPEGLPDTIELLDIESAWKRGRPLREARPDQFEESVRSIKFEDLATIIYTSGTTGEPKGVMLSHRNLISNIEASLQVLPLESSDIHLSFLPLSHVFERMAGYYAMLRKGVRIAFAESIQTVPENLLEVRPTVLLAVPRFYEKIKARLDQMQEQLTGFRKKLFSWALRVAQAHGDRRRQGQSVGPLLALKYRLADALVFKKIRARTGGRIRILVSGAAPLPKDIAEFFDNLGMRILEGYGLTESSPVIAVNRPNDWKPGTVGKPIPGVEVKIAEDGEILARGPNIMMGYYNRPEATKQAIDEEGWLHTGDIGEIDEDGFLRITDRKKDIIVTAGGKNVAPQFVENTIKRHPWIEEVMVIGDGKPYPAAFIVPSREIVENWAKDQGIEYESFEDLCRHPDVIKKFESILEEVQEPLARFERVKKFVLLPEPFTIEGGELTPTLKVRRRVVLNKYADRLPELYPEEA